MCIYTLQGIEKVINRRHCKNQKKIRLHHLHCSKLWVVLWADILVEPCDLYRKSNHTYKKENNLVFASLQYEDRLKYSSHVPAMPQM